MLKPLLDGRAALRLSPGTEPKRLARTDDVRRRRVRKVDEWVHTLCAVHDKFTPAQTYKLPVSMSTGLPGLVGPCVSDTHYVGGPHL